MYPTCVGESPDGAVFVCVDPNLSLSTLKGVGRVMRLVDTDDDGRADTYTTFAEMDSPRGVASDGRTVYVMHPPNLTAYRDTNGDGIADASTVLVTGLGFDLDFRGADHTTNNIQLGPDGWLYVAVGDYGFMKAVGTDGKQIQHRGGAVVRVRPDGTNLELVDRRHAQHLRRRDRSVRAALRARQHERRRRLEHAPALPRAGRDHGLPVALPELRDRALPDDARLRRAARAWARCGSRIRRGPPGTNNDAVHRRLDHAAHLPPLAHAEGRDLRRRRRRTSSPCCGPPISRSTATPTCTSRASPAGSSPTTRDTVGYVVRVRPTARHAGARAERRSRATDARAPRQLASGNCVHRVHAQQELVRRGAKAADRRRPAPARSATRSCRADARAAAIFTLKQLQGAKANAALASAASAADPRVREIALRALADRTDQLQGVAPALFVKALADADPQVQVQAIHGLVRLGARDRGRVARFRSRRAPIRGSRTSPSTRSPRSARRTRARGARQRAVVRAGALRALAQDARARRRHRARRATGQGERRRHARRARCARSRGSPTARRRGRATGGRRRPAHLGPYFDPAAWEESPRIRVGARHDARRRIGR